MMRLILLFVLSMSQGFLLHTNSPLNYGTQTAGNQQCISKSELYDTQNHLQNEVNYVRNEINFVQNDMNKKLDLLTSQLQQMLDSFQQQIITGQRSHNDSKAVESLGLKFIEVVENYTKLQDKFDSLLIKHVKQEIELQSLVNETIELKDEIVNSNSLKYKQEIELQSLKNKTNELEDEIVDLISLKNKQEVELLSVKNKTKELVDEIANLNSSLKNINQLTDFRLLQQEVQSISAQTHSLAVNEQARIQDFQALYKSLKQHELNEGGIIQNINLTLYQTIQSSEISNNAKMSNVTNEMEELKKSLNVSFLGIHKKITKNSEKVVLTACVANSEYGTKLPGQIIKYSDIRAQVNVNNLSSFRNSGKFTCEKEGVYLVSAWHSTNIQYSEFLIKKNENSIVHAFTTDSNSGNYYTATAVVAVELLSNDTVYVQVYQQMYVFNYQRSCLTIVKVK